ncbi:hypothetical protein PInf_026354 [Phytophthora infestans]|nr:hypothetical protein PInf_026354 [Phytophthora infestans]
MDRSELPRLNDSQYESVWKMGDIFGQDVFRSLAAATSAEQQERVTAFETYERGLIAHVRGSLEASMAAPQAIRPKLVWLKVPAFEGKEGENVHFGVREVEIAMKAGLISDESIQVAFSLSNLGGRAKPRGYTRETTSPGCFASWAQLCEQLRPRSYRRITGSASAHAFSRVIKEYVQEMRTLVASLVGNPLPEAVKTTVFMDGLKVGPARTQLFRVQATTIEEAIPALQEEYSHKQAGTPPKEEHRHDEDGVPRKAEHRSNDAAAPAVTQPAGTVQRARTHGLKLSRELGPML